MHYSVVQATLGRKPDGFSALESLQEKVAVPYPPLPRYSPMLPTEGKLPPPDEDGRYAYEVKYDGWCTLAYVERGALRLESKNGADLTARCPELEPLGKALRRRRAVLHGELVVLDERGRPDFNALAGRMLRSAPPPVVVLMVFDLLHLDEKSLVGLPWEDRRRQLAELELNGPLWQTVSHQVGRGAELLAATREMGLEGLVAKRLGSRYEPGQRTKAWLKIKNWERRSLVIGGYVPGARGSVRAVLVGRRRGTELEYVGRVKHGLGRAVATVLASLRCPRATFGREVGRGVQHVEPRLIADVQWLAGVESLRHAVVKKVRVLEPDEK